MYYHELINTNNKMPLTCHLLHYLGYVKLTLDWIEIELQLLKRKTSMQIEVPTNLQC